MFWVYVLLQTRIIYIHATAMDPEPAFTDRFQRKCWPQFRIPPWIVSSTHPAAAIEHVVRLVYGEQSPRGIVYVESGVYLANTTVAVMGRLGHVLQDVHLVDPWDDNSVMLAAADWQGISFTSSEVIAE